MNDFAGIARTLDEAGRLKLPAEILALLNIRPLDELSITIDPTRGAVVLQCAAHRCARCGAREDLTYVKMDLYLCRSCIKKLYAMQTPTCPHAE